MYDHGMVGPVIALVAWTLIVLLWMYATRIPAMSKAKINPQDFANGAPSGTLPPGVEAIAKNYNHLHEQPTIFYALALAMQAGGFVNELNIGLAWGYVIIRVIHSLVQNTVNLVTLRFTIFLLGSAVLAALTVRALMAMM